MTNFNTVYVLGLDYEVKDEIPWQDAVTNILMGKMSPFKVHETKRVRSCGNSVDMAWPLIVRLNYWREVPRRKPVELDSKASRYDILKRDGWTCGYCGDRLINGDKNGKAPTVDHILPESRGGKWTWGNLVAACQSCNSEKADRTPEEAGMKLLWAPYVGTKGNYAHIQKEVWQILEEGGGFVEEALHYEGIIK